jgi:hypothetical protein
MQCPLNFDNLFSELSKVCKKCEYFNPCKAFFDYEEESKEPPLPLLNNNIGDNFPTYNNISIRLHLSQERKDFVKELINEEQNKITKEEIEDAMLDIDIYNSKCKKSKKKRRKKSDDNL